MDRLEKSCWAAANYPKNLISPDAYEYQLNEYAKRLDHEEQRLFGDADSALVDILQLGEKLKDFDHLVARSEGEIKTLLRGTNLPLSDHPFCRFIFIHAPNSRGKLRTTRNMLMYALTFHQVMPAFLDFVFPFGDQERPTDFYFSGFRHDNRLANPDGQLAVGELGRSGQILQLCYNLKSVESTDKPKLPWSIRQTAVYHCFDVQTGHTTWVMVKGNLKMRNRIKQATGSGSRPDLKDFGSVSGAFSASLSAHLIVCEWAVENWRWYINDLEKLLEEKTGHAASYPVERSSSEAEEVRAPPINAFIDRPARRQSTMGSSKSSPLEKIRRVVSFKELVHPRVTTAYSPTQAQEVQPHGCEDVIFRFSDLQTVQIIKEKANEAFVVLKANIDIMSELIQYYQSIFRSKYFTQLEWQKADAKAGPAFSHFEERVSGIINDIRMQQLRLESLARLVGERKQMLLAILEYKNTDANKKLAAKAQLSAERSLSSAIEVEKLTKQMHDIARKTERETILMRIITLVTLFFLPGTFVSTLMSTDIIKFSSDSGKPERDFSLAALQLYLALSLPFMFFTFLAAWVSYRWVSYKDKIRRKWWELTDSEPKFGA